MNNNEIRKGEKIFLLPSICYICIYVHHLWWPLITLLSRPVGLCCKKSESQCWSHMSWKHRNKTSHYLQPTASTDCLWENIYAWWKKYFIFPSFVQQQLSWGCACAMLWTHFVGTGQRMDNKVFAAQLLCCPVLSCLCFVGQHLLLYFIPGHWGSCQDIDFYWLSLVFLKSCGFICHALLNLIFHQGICWSTVCSKSKVLKIFGSSAQKYFRDKNI